MNDFRADMHCHSTCSDGSTPPIELVDLALAKGLSGLSITDHDTVDAYPIVLPYAKEKGLRIVSGVEFSTTHQGESVHILGYSFNRNEPAITKLCERHMSRRKKRNSAILEKLTKYGMPLSEEELSEIASTEADSKNKRTAGRPHIALAMIKKGYVGSVSEAFHKYIGEGKLCYVSGDSISTEETIATIHEAKGFAIIAHPHLIDDQSLVNKLLNMNFDGIECYYAMFTPNREKRWVDLGTRKKWIMTGGSDYHGSVKPNIPLGCSWVNETIFNQLQKVDEENNK